MRYFLGFLLSLVLFSLSLLLYLFLSLGGTNELSPELHYEHCVPIVGAKGAEDIELDASTGLAYVSADDRRSHSSGEQDAGAIYRVKVNGGDPALEKMQGTESLPDFHPHGISFFQEDREKYLYVISHRSPENASLGHDIYLFRIDGVNLIEVSRLNHDLIRSPNDIVALSREEFYFSNDRKAVEGWPMYLEVLFGLRGSGIVHYKNGRFRELVNDLAFANGIALQQSDDTLWVSESRASTLRSYRRDSESGDLTLLEIMPLGNSPDNISVIDKGNLLVADHVNGVRQIRNVSEAAYSSPSRIWFVDRNRGGKQLLIARDGRDFSAVSVAVATDEKLLLGSIYNDGLLLCSRPE